jgi:protein-S-isoprenylcysteine O-methyltransferase Ste14
VSRVAVTGIFAALTLATGTGAIAAWADALADPGVRSGAIAGHWLLKLGVVLAFCIFVFLREPSRRPSREPVAFLACAAAILAVIALREPPEAASTALVVAGELVTVAFGVWLLVSVLALGRCFGVLPEARGLVTHGPYRLVRHPVYLGELGAAAGLVLAAPTAWNAGVLAVFLGAQAVRMRLEERALAAEFPDYSAYAARTPRLVPRPRASAAARPAGSLPAATLALAGSLLAAQAAGAAPAVPPVVGPPPATVVESLPAFGWDAVRGAERYEWQIAADPAFNSPVLGSSHDRFFTKNTRATMAKVVPNGDYWWRVRAVAPDGAVSPWSAGSSITKLWAAAPTLEAPEDGATISYPDDTFALSWSPVPGAARYLVRIGTDPSLASLVLPGAGVETQATTYTLLGPLAPGKTYYWGITPIDAAGNRGEPSGVWAFTWLWPSATAPSVTDVASDPEIYDHRFEWDPVPGAAGYELEVSSSSDFAPGSRVCCPVNSTTGLTTIGTSYSPAIVLPNNNRYYWRVRAVDPSGNAGVWNLGPEFLKAFDNVLPSIQSLRMAEGSVGEHPGRATTTPIVLWDPVPGASSYEVEVTRFVDGCQWTATQEHWRNTTATAAWTPLGWGWNRQKPYQSAMGVGSDTPTLVSGHSYCVRVTALDRPSDGSATIRSAETYLPDESSPAFTWLGPPAGEPCSPSCGTGALGSDDYLLPLRGSTTTSVPVFRWEPLTGYQSYFVIVAKDEEFTNVVDYAFTRIPAYAPRGSGGARTYPDETTLYYWAVLPATGGDGSGVVTAPRFSAPATFHKQSEPPELLSPAPGTVFSGAPTFHWAPAAGARRYRLEVASDPSFASLVDTVLTDSTSYTSSAPYPADTALYWRVRADAENADTGNAVALRWSAPRTFSKTLLAPLPSPDNPTGGDGVPTWSWDPVPGAVSYDFQLRFPNGVLRDFRGVPSAAATPTLLKGTGIWTWQVRANFPRVSSSAVTPGPWSLSRSFTRTIREPANPSEEVAGRRVVLRWSPKLGALNYRVQVSTRADFGTLVQSATTENTTFAPLLTQYQYAAGGTFYWRVAAADDTAGNAGDFTLPRSFTLPPVTILRAGSRITVKVRRVRGTLRVTGAVSPAHRGTVKVALARRSGGAFRPLASRVAMLKATSTYATSFPRPARGACRVTATFPGDRDHLPSTVRLRFSC